MTRPTTSVSGTQALHQLCLRLPDFLDETNEPSTEAHLSNAWAIEFAFTELLNVWCALTDDEAAAFVPDDDGIDFDAVVAGPLEDVPAAV